MTLTGRRSGKSRTGELGASTDQHGLRLHVPRVPARFARWIPIHRMVPCTPASDPPVPPAPFGPCYCRCAPACCCYAIAIRCCVPATVLAARVLLPLSAARVLLLACCCVWLLACCCVPAPAACMLCSCAASRAYACLRMLLACSAHVLRCVPAPAARVVRAVCLHLLLTCYDRSTTIRDENGTDIFRPYLKPNLFRGVKICPYPSPDIQHPIPYPYPNTQIAYL